MLFFQRLKSRSKSDRGDSTLVTFLLVMPLFFAFLITMIDTSIYFANRTMVQHIARDGARTVAIFGGSGNATQVTPLEKQYGSSGACTSEIAATKTSIECNVIQRLSTASLTNVNVTKVTCGPVQSGHVGATTFCDVEWEYLGLPGSTMNFISFNNTSDDKSDGGFFFSNRTRATSESEVKMNEVPLVPRG